MHKNQQVKQIRNRNECIAWWVRTFAANPSGLVPIPTAARVLGVSTTRVRALINEGRLTVIEGMPGGNTRDRFIPLEQLITAPFGMDAGRPGLYGPKNRPNQHLAEKTDEWFKQRNAKDIEEYQQRHPEYRPEKNNNPKKTRMKRKALRVKG